MHLVFDKLSHGLVMYSLLKQPIVLACSVALLCYCHRDGHFFSKWANSSGDFQRVNSLGHFW